MLKGRRRLILKGFEVCEAYTHCIVLSTSIFTSPLITFESGNREASPLCDRN
jgi:hypothetical protein